MEAIRDLLAEHGLSEEFDPRWLEASLVREDPVERHRFEGLMDEFFIRFTKLELLEMCFNRENPVFAVPTDNPMEVANSPQLVARGFVMEVEHPELEESIGYAGPPYRLPESPWRIARRAPLIGEHNDDIYRGILCLSEDDVARLERNGVI